MKHVIGIALLMALSGCTSVWDVYPTPRAVTVTENTPAVVYTPIAPQPKASIFVHDPAVRHEMAINFAGRGADYAMTFAVLRHGGEEMNPLLKPVFGNAEAKNVAYAVAVDALFTHVLGKIAEHAKKNGDPNWRRILRWNAYIHFGLATWNAGQYMTNRQTVSAP